MLLSEQPALQGVTKEAGAIVPGLHYGMQKHLCIIWS